MGNEDQKPSDFVPIPQEGVIDIPAGSSLQGVVAHLGEKTNFLTIVAYAIVITLSIGVAGMFFTVAGILTDTWRYNATSYIDYQNAQKENDKKFETVDAEFGKIQSAISGINDNLSKISGQLDEVKKNSHPAATADRP